MNRLVIYINGKFTLAKPLVVFTTELSGISYYTWNSNKHIAR